MSQNEQAIKALTTKLRWLLDEVATLPEASASRTLRLRDNMIMYFIGIQLTETPLMQYPGN